MKKVFVIFAAFAVFGLSSGFTPVEKAQKIQIGEPCVEVNAFFASPNATGGVTARMRWVPENGNKWLKITSDNFSQDPIYVLASWYGGVHVVDMLPCSTVTLEVFIGNNPNPCFKRDVAIGSL